MPACPWVPPPALIDLRVQQAKCQHTFITAKLVPSVLDWNVWEAAVVTQEPWHLQAAHVHRFLHLSQGHNPRSSVCCGGPPPSFLLTDFFPFFWSQSETVLLTAFSISMNWSKPHFHFVPRMAFLQSTHLWFLPAHFLTRKNISDGWEHRNRILFSFFIKGK